MNHNSINFDCWRGKSLEFLGTTQNTHLSSNPGALIASGLTVVCQVKGFLKTNFDSSAYLAPKPSTYCMMELSSSSFSFVNSNLPPEPPLAEVHCAALCRAWPMTDVDTWNKNLILKKEKSIFISWRLIFFFHCYIQMNSNDIKVFLNM